MLNKGVENTIIWTIYSVLTLIHSTTSLSIARHVFASKYSHTCKWLSGSGQGRKGNRMYCKCFRTCAFAIESRNLSRAYGWWCKVCYDWRCREWNQNHITILLTQRRSPFLLAGYVACHCLANLLVYVALFFWAMEFCLGTQHKNSARSIKDLVSQSPKLKDKLLYVVSWGGHFFIKYQDNFIEVV